MQKKRKYFRRISHGVIIFGLDLNINKKSCQFCLFLVGIILRLTLSAFSSNRAEVLRRGI